MACLGVVAGPHEHVDALLRGARFWHCSRLLRRRAQARQLSAQRRDALSRVLAVQVDQRLAVVGHLRDDIEQLGLREQVASQLEEWNLATTYTVACSRPIDPGYSNPGRCI